MIKASRGHVLSAKQTVAAELIATDRVLDIGCGTGELAVMLAAQGTRVDGFDINPKMIKIARERIVTENLESAFFVQHMGVDGMDGLATSVYDGVVSTLVFSELSGDERRFAYKHAARVLKPNGIIVIADEVVPRKTRYKLLHTITRVPMLLATYLVAGTTTRPLSNLSEELTAAGFAIEKEIRSHGDSFAIVVGRLTQEKQI
jgi:demethylmenaquinone methyltransferase/2-methoxy-6-polyprenyl-1,4-benzoquinol methylase